MATLMEFMGTYTAFRKYRFNTNSVCKKEHETLWSNFRHFPAVGCFTARTEKPFSRPSDFLSRQPH